MQLQENVSLSFLAGTGSSFVVLFSKLMRGDAAALLLEATQDKETETEFELNDLMKDNKTMGRNWMMKLEKNVACYALFVLLLERWQGGRIFSVCFEQSS